MAVGGQITDTATLAGGIGPVGTIVFVVYGPDDVTCSGSPAFSIPLTVAGNGDYTSDPFTPFVPGTYRWVASYLGDGVNAPVSTACNDPDESVVVTRALPSLVTRASPPVAVGGQITDTATLAGGIGPVGTIVFVVYGPDDANCSGSPAFSIPLTVAGNGDYTSDPFTPSLPGTYRWVASYLGDGVNAPVSTACNDPDESVVVDSAAPTLTTQASGSAIFGGQTTDRATLAGGFVPAGSITFLLYGPDDATCGGTAVFSSTRPVAGNGDYTSQPYTPVAAGTYRWVASYTGDPSNLPATTACDDPGETVVVPPPTTTSTTSTTTTLPPTTTTSTSTADDHPRPPPRRRRPRRPPRHDDHDRPRRAPPRRPRRVRPARPRRARPRRARRPRCRRPLPRPSR